MKKVFLVLYVLATAALIYAVEPVRSDESVNIEENTEAINTKYSHSRVALTGYVPYFGTYLLSASQFLVPQDLRQHTTCLESLLLNIPAAIVNPAYTLTGSAITTGVWSSGIYLENKENIYGNPSLAYTFENIGFKGNMWLQYKGYEKARSLCSSEVYGDYENISFMDAVFGCYDPKILSKKSVWIPVLSITALNIGFSALGGFDKSVFKTGESYIGHYQVPIAAGLATVLALSCLDYTFTGIGEEALFRGIGYEEMKVSMGLWPAKLIDALGFPAVHTPQYVLSGYDATTILLTFGVQSGITFLLQWIYDKGGLKDSIAAHMWIDVLSSVTTYLFTSGIEDNNFALNISFSTKL